MSQPNEITIRIASPLRFIDDDSESAEEYGQESLNTLSLVKKKETSASLSPQISKDLKVKQRNQPIELTIRGENTVINISSAGRSKENTRRSGKDSEEDEMYAAINQTVREIFQTPGNEEIEKALENVGGKDRKFAMKGRWKSLSRSAKATEKNQTQRDRDERYPSIVLLQDPPEEKTEDQYPKMVTMENTNLNLHEKPKFEYRSKSMLSLPASARKDYSSVLNELSQEKHSIAIEKTYLEKDKKNLEEERRGLERGRAKLEKEKKTLQREKSFRLQDRQILHDKKQVMEEERSLSPVSSKDGSSLIRKEKLCLAMEKQLLEDEKKILADEHGILLKEHQIIEKERSILGGEKSVLEEERAIFGKERVVMEKQKNFSDEIRYRDEERCGESIANGSEDFLSEIDGVFEDTCKLYADGKPRGNRLHRPGRFTPSDVSLYNPSWTYNNPYPMYVPVYNLPHCRGCPRPVIPARTSKSIQTQTDGRQLDPTVQASGLSPDPEIPDLPFGLLSGLFPRVVITSMKTYPDGSEELHDNEKNAKITELPSEEPKTASLQGPSNKTKKNAKPRSTNKKKVAEPNTLKIPMPDLSLKAACLAETTKSTDIPDDPQTDESGIETLTSELHARGDEFFTLSDETISVETLHFGNLDDFYGNDMKNTMDPESSQGREDSGHPLTNLGHSMYEKLCELRLEPDQVPVAESVKTENVAEEVAPRCSDGHVNIDFGRHSLSLKIEGQINIVVSSSSFEERRNEGKFLPMMDTADKKIIEQNELWYTDKFSKYSSRQRKDINFTLDMNSGIKSETHAVNISLSRGTTLRISTSDQRDFKSSFWLGLTDGGCTREAQVGTDDYIMGHNRSTSSWNTKELSPRKCTLLQRLQDKLEYIEKTYETPRRQPLFSVKPLPRPRPRPKVPEEIVTREYFCEDCLATMRLYEDQFTSVQDIVQKFELLNTGSR